MTGSVTDDPSSVDTTHFATNADSPVGKEISYQSPSSFDD